uniref:RING-type domain-containing protein n=1 Tax=Rhodosorus marinus TaxID=101924 RepID=A0A7S0G1Q5_9RHOD
MNARYDAISKLGSFVFGDSSAQSSSGQQIQNGSDSDEPLCCAICLDDFESGQTARQLACNHVYHKECIDPWLLQSSSCPICKRVIGELPPPLSNDFYGSVSAV